MTSWSLTASGIGKRRFSLSFRHHSTYNFLVALAFSQMFNLLCERADNVHGGRLPHHVRVLWDEAANTGQVPQLEKLVAVIRSREVSVRCSTSSWPSARPFTTNTRKRFWETWTAWYSWEAVRPAPSRKYPRNWLGKATISMQTESRSRGQSESYSQNNQRLGRELMTPSELATMPGDKCILQLRGLPRSSPRKYDLKSTPITNTRLKPTNRKNAF